MFSNTTFVVLTKGDIDNYTRVRVRRKKNK
jgi:hypothetical protein